MAKQGSNGDFTLDKALPSSIEAERLILGVVLLDNVAINQAAENLKPDDFFIGSNRRIYEKMLALYERGQGIDPLTLQEELRRAGELEQVGGPAYIAALFDGVPRFSNIENYVDLVKGKSMLRRLITSSNQIMALAFDDEEEPEQILDKAESMILAIGEDRIKQGFVHIGDVAARQLTVIEETAGREQLITGLATGFSDLDYMTSGLQRGDLIIIAARPSMGKCLTADSEIVLADGSVATIEELYRRGEAELLTLGGDFKFRLARPSAFVDDGIKPVYRVTTRLGRYVDSTLSHPYLTIDGWRKLAELKAGDHVAAARRVNVFGSEELHEGQVKLLAYLIGDGNLTNTNPSFTNTDPRLQLDFAQSLAAFPGLKVRAQIDGKRAPAFYVASDFDQIGTERGAFASRLRDPLNDRGAARTLAKKLDVSPSLAHFWLQGECAPRQELFKRLFDCLDVSPQELAPNGLTAMSRASRNPLTLWLEEVGLWGLDSQKKFIPAIVFRLTQPQLAMFLNRLFSTDGWVALNEGQAPQLGYSTVSEKLARQIQSLLLRFGVIAKLRKREIKYADTRRASWQLDITHGDSIRAFAELIGIFGKEDRLREAVRRLSTEETRNNRDLIPERIWKEIGLAKGIESWTSIARRAGLKGHSDIHVGSRALSRGRLAAIGGALNDNRLGASAHSDIYWDEIVSIEYLGDKQVYDLTIPETHNFVANDICVHNTAFSLNIAQNAATRPQYNGEKAVVGVFSLEMSNEQLVNRLLCSQARVDAHRLRSGYLSKDEWRRLAVSVGELAETKIYLDDTPGISVLEMRAKARRLKNEQKALDLLIVDYLQLMSGRGRNESRQQEVSQISRELKMLAKELNVPLIALSQLSRAPETRTGSHKPQLSDLRESGSIEQDADVVMFIYREEVYKPETEKQNIAEIIIGKQRNGPIGSVELIFLKQLTRFEDKYREQA
jgi:replicative DNA helicase